MNKQNLHAIFTQYIDRFEELHFSKACMESYKWPAIHHFQKVWDIDTADFPDMFKNAIKETDVLINSSKVQPTGGITLLLKHENEIEFVRESFRTLFSQDEGNLKSRQERVNDFVHAINEHLEQFKSGSWKYAQNYNHTINYLNLWDPAGNFLFKSKEASLWADCIEYDDDFGTGSSFSLEKYYKMCDELLQQILENEEIMQLHNSMLEKLKIDVEDNYHLLVYDIIYCAHAYGLYKSIHIPKCSTKERICRAKQRAEDEKIEAEIQSLSTELASLIKNPPILPDITGDQIVHKKYGPGVVQTCDSDGLTVNFQDETKEFQYPEALLQGFLTISDNSIYNKAEIFSNYTKKINSLEKRIKILTIS